MHVLIIKINLHICLISFSREIHQFPVKLTDPVTAILYITADMQHMRDLNEAIHIKGIAEGMTSVCLTLHSELHLILCLSLQLLPMSTMSWLCTNMATITVDFPCCSGSPLDFSFSSSTCSFSSSSLMNIAKAQTQNIPEGNTIYSRGRNCGFWCVWVFRFLLSMSVLIYGEFLPLIGWLRIDLYQYWLLLFA